MSLWKIAWRSIQRRALASTLTSLSMALGVMLVVAVLLVHGVVAESFRNNSGLGYNMIVGAKGGRLQLVLNTVFYLSSPVENIPYSYYQEFLGREQRSDGRDGRFKKFTQLVIPVCLGDYFQQYRVVGTIPQMFDDFVYDPDTGRKYEFAAGRNFQTLSPEFGYFEAVVGARVARETGVQVGDLVTPTHGPEGEAHDQFHVVGILASSGTPVDRALFVNIEGFYLLEGHAKPVAGEAHDDLPLTEDPAGADLQAAVPAAHAADGHAADHAPHGPDPLPIHQREVTALLVRTVSPLVTPGLSNTINEGPAAQAVLPIAEIYTLFEMIVKPIQRLLLIITAMICVVSGVGILVSIYNSMSDRRHEIAVMRALGAGRGTVMAVVLLESIFLALGGGLAGWFAGHALIGLAAPAIEAQTGVTIGPMDLAPPVNLLAYLSPDPIMDLSVSAELLLVPALILLAIIVGFLPALAAYRTDVARALSVSP